MDKPLNIAFWQKESGNALSSNKGLDKQQIEGLKDLVRRAEKGEAVRFILFRNKKEGETQPEFNLKVFQGTSGSRDDGGL